MSLKTASLTSLVVAASMAAYYLAANRAPKPNALIQYRDVNRDEITDLIVSPKDDYAFVLLGRRDNTFAKAEIITNDGTPFYKTGEGVYDSWGQFFPGHFVPPQGKN